MAGFVLFFRKQTMRCLAKGICRNNGLTFTFLKNSPVINSSNSPPVYHPIQDYAYLRGWYPFKFTALLQSLTTLSLFTVKTLPEPFVGVLSLSTFSVPPGMQNFRKLILNNSRSIKTQLSGYPLMRQGSLPDTIYLSNLQFLYQTVETTN